MTWRIAITPDIYADGIALQIGRHYPGGDTIEYLTYTSHSESTPVGTTLPEASLKLSDDLARALLDALAEHYAGTTSSRQQRADYEHERTRVDRLIGALIGKQQQ